MNKTIVLFVVLVSVALPTVSLAKSPLNVAYDKQQLARAARAYFNAQNNNDWDKACRMLSRRALNEQGGLAGCKDNFATNGFAVSAMDIDRVTVLANGTRGVVYTHLFNNPSQKWNLAFVRENGLYKLDRDY